MKRCFWVWCLFIGVNALAQNRTNVWELCYFNTDPYPLCELHYQNGIMDTVSVFRETSIFITDASICDTSGNLLFYTNGIIIENRNYDTLFNSTNFNPGESTEAYYDIGSPICQGALIIPFPESDSKYYIIYVSADYLVANNTFEAQPLYLSYSVIDMEIDAGNGGIIEDLMNIHLVDDTLTLGGLTAVKHANGTDWWVIAHRYYSDLYYKFLITADGIEGPFQQHIGSKIKYDVLVQSTFSPDGSKFCFSNHGGWFDYMDFDRCTGEFSNSVTVESLDSLSILGNSFSPNGRFLYISSSYNLYQYDTWSPDMVTNPIHIATWDNFEFFSIPVLFFMHQLAPDNRIYVSPYNGVPYIGMIDSPDSLGIACNFLQHSLKLPDHEYTHNIPSFPNYDLGLLPGGDTCNIVYTPQTFSLKGASTYRIAPNPVSDFLNIIYQSNEDALLELFDLYGKRVGAISLFHYFKNRLLNVSELPPGVYLAAVSCKGERVWSEKVVVQR